MSGGMAKCTWLSLIVLFSVAFVAYSQDEPGSPSDQELGQEGVNKVAKPVVSTKEVQVPCEFKVVVQTGSMKGAGTDAIVRLAMYDKGGNKRSVRDLKKFGKLSVEEHDFFEKGEEDEFIIRQRCLPFEVCKVMLSHNNGGNSPDWYVEYVTIEVAKVTSTPITYSKVRRFDFDRWLSKNQTLSATVDLCD